MFFRAHSATAYASHRHMVAEHAHSESHATVHAVPSAGEPESRTCRRLKSIGADVRMPCFLAEPARYVCGPIHRARANIPPGQASESASRSVRYIHPLRTDLGFDDVFCVQTRPFRKPLRSHFASGVCVTPSLKLATEPDLQFGSCSRTMPPDASREEAAPFIDH